MYFYISEFSLSIDWQTIGIIATDLALVAILLITIKFGKSNKK